MALSSLQSWPGQTTFSPVSVSGLHTRLAVHCEHWSSEDVTSESGWSNEGGKMLKMINFLSWLYLFLTLIKAVTGKHLQGIYFLNI